MPRIYVGTTVERLPLRKYARELSFAELMLSDPLPKVSTLSAWRSERPANFMVSLVASPSLYMSEHGAFRETESLEAGKIWITDAVAALKAQFILFATPSEMSPSKRERTLFCHYIDSLSLTQGCQVAWQAGGLWQPELATAFAQESSITLVGNPLGQKTDSYDPSTQGEQANTTCYYRARAMGSRNRFSDSILYTLAERLSENPGTDAVYLALSSPTSFDEAVKLKRLLQELDCDVP